MTQASAEWVLRLFLPLTISQFPLLAVRNQWSDRTELEEHPLGATGGHLSEAAVVEGDGFTHGCAPVPSHHPASPNPRCSCQGACHVLRDITQGLHVPCGPQAWEVLPSSQGGECPKLWAQHPLPGSAEAERGGRRARLGGGSWGREAPLPPAPWLVPSTFALSNFVVGKYLLKIRHFVTFFLTKNYLSRVFPDLCSEET